MHLCVPRHPFVLLALLAGPALAPAGCSAEPEPSGALRASFPDLAAQVLDGHEPFAPTGDGFVLRASLPSRGFRDGLRAELPRDGEGLLRLSAAGGFSIQVREMGAAGAGRLTGSALSLPR